MTDGISNVAMSPTVTYKDLQNCLMELHRVRGPVENAENVYINPIDFPRLQQANYDYPFPSLFVGIKVIQDEVIPAGHFYIMTVDDFELYKYLKSHPMLTDEKMIEVSFKLIKNGVIDNPLNKHQ